MSYTVTRKNVFALILASLAVTAILACAAEEPAAPEAPAPARAAEPAVVPAPAPAIEVVEPQAPQAPQQAAPARPATLPEAPTAPGVTGSAPSAAPRSAPEAMEGAMTAAEYVPPVQEPGIPLLFGEGYSPKPTKFSENPRFAAMVREGSLPPVEQRLPHPEDVFVYPPVDEIGIYGGNGRLWGSRLFNNIMTGLAVGGTCAEWDNDGLSYYPATCMSFSTSVDGRVYTVTLRRDLKWSDGAPFTMQDVEWAWSEDLNYNRELFAVVPGVLQDPVTGEAVKFTKIDDHTLTLSFDNPNYTFIEAARLAAGQGCTRMTSCFFEPFHFSKKFHPNYADPAEYKKLMTEGGHEDWTQVWMSKYSLRYDADIPVTHAFYLCDGGADDQETLCANPYFHGVDHQLPYLDSYTYNKAENISTSVFRSMNGETDGPYAGDFVLAEVPLYFAHMEKGDYSVGRWTKTHGNDAGIQINPEFNLDPELGQLFRTKEFREALSLSMDRNAINQLVYLGLGTPQAWAPHPATPYYPGDEWPGYLAQPDIEKANEILDGLGLVDTDGDGFRNRLDGTGNVEIFSEFRPNFMPVAELLQSQWADMGINLDFKEGANRAFGREEAPIRMRAMSLMTNPWYWTQFLPYRASGPGREMGRYFETGGVQGMAPVGAAQVECPSCSENEFLPLAPQGRYPADPDGFLMEMQDLYKDGKQYQMLDPARVENGKALFRLNLENTYHLGTVGFTGGAPGVFFKRNNLRNVPTTFGAHDYYTYDSPLWYFEDGIDNFSNPGRRSVKYGSTNFLECPHIASDKC